MSEKKQNYLDRVIDSIIEFFFSENSLKWLFLIMVIGFILRFWLLSNIGPLADESVHGVHAINIINSGVINTQNQCSVWFYLTDIGYRIFGISAITSRLLSLIFGTLSIAALYLIAEYLFNKKIALISSFLLAISYFHIRFNLTTMDGAMMFFVLMMFYYFIRDLNEKNKLSYFVPVLAGIAVLIKPIVLVFGVSMFFYLIYFIYKKPILERKDFIKQNKKRIFLSVIILVLFSTPVLAYNYILYTQKGISDVLFSRFFGVSREIYSGLAGYDQSWNFNEAMDFLPTALLEYFLMLSPFIFIFGILGIILTFTKKKYKNARFFCLFFLLPFIFLLGSGKNQIHFVSFINLFSLTSALLIEFISRGISKKSKISEKNIILIILIIIFLFNIYMVFPHLTSKSGAWKMREYALDNFNKNDLVVADSRIYRGKIAWMFNEYPYLEANYFSQVLDLNNQLSSKKIPVTMYYIECVPDDCGWGTIKDQPEFNQSMELLLQSIQNQTIKQKTIYGGGGYDGNGDINKKSYLNIYKATIQISPEVYSAIQQTHNWFYYPVRWYTNDYYDYYQPEGVLQSLLNDTGKVLLWVAVILAILSMSLPFYEIKKQN